MADEKRTPLRETGLFAHIYKFFSLLVETAIKPIMNLDPPEVHAHIRDIPYVSGRANKKQRLDVIIPKGTGPFSILVYVHGGGFMTLDKSHYTRMAKAFASEGYLVFNVNYRRAPAFRYPINISDVAKAVSWVIQNARAYRGDPTKLFLAGDSAGAHLVATYSTALEDPSLIKAFRMGGVKRPERVNGLVLLYGAFDCDTTLATGFRFVRTMLQSFLSRDPALYEERAKNASPIRHITSAYPPCFITYAEKDKLSSESRAFAAKLESFGVEHEVLAIPPSECRFIAHGFVSTFWRECAKKAMARAVAFMEKHRE